MRVNGDGRRACILVRSTEQFCWPFANRKYVCIPVLDLKLSFGFDLAWGHHLTLVFCRNNLRWRWAAFVESISLHLDDQFVSLYFRMWLLIRCRFGSMQSQVIISPSCVLFKYTKIAMVDLHDMNEQRVRWHSLTHIPCQHKLQWHWFLVVSMERFRWPAQTGGTFVFLFWGFDPVWGHNLTLIESENVATVCVRLSWLQSTERFHWPWTNRRYVCIAACLPLAVLLGFDPVWSQNHLTRNSIPRYTKMAMIDVHLCWSHQLDGPVRIASTFVFLCLTLVVLLGFHPMYSHNLTLIECENVATVGVHLSWLQSIERSRWSCTHRAYVCILVLDFTRAIGIRFLVKW